MREVFSAPAELKFVGEPSAGEIEGYASVFGVIDAHGDLIEPGAFDDTLAEHKSHGSMPGMYGEHSYHLGGDPYPIGEWTEIAPDDKGLRVKGHLIALEHPDVSRVHQLMQRKVIRGLSIAWSGREGGVVRGTKAGEPRRYLKSIDLFTVDPVRDPSNRFAQIDGVKAMLQMPHHQAAAQAIQEAHQMCLDSMGGGDAPTSDERNKIFGKIREGYRHLTGQDLPMSTKMRFDQLRELKKWLHLPVEQGGRGFSNSQADEIAELVFKSMPRDESGDQAAANAARKEAVKTMGQILSGFSLKFGD